MQRKTNQNKKFVLMTLLSLSLGIASCTQGQGPGGEQPKVTTAGTETPPAPVDVCEKQENLDNILCRWVATELKIEAGGKPQATVQFIYDETGAPFRITGVDDKGEKSLLNLYYNNFGLRMVENFSEPNPPDSENFTQESIKTTNFNSSDGSIISIISETFLNSQRQYSEESYYFYNVPNQIIIGKVNKDASGNITGGTRQTITKDPTSGKYSSLEETSGPITLPALVINPIQYWAISTYEYDTGTGGTGRLKKIEKNSQNCQVPNRPCGQTLDPTQIQTTGIKYDDQGRVAGLTMDYEGEVDTNNNITSPVHQAPDPDTTMNCEFKYDLQTQGKLAKMNPMQIVMSIYPFLGFDLTFSEKDIFTTFSCTPSGTSTPAVLMTARWVRLWEALPEGKPPGS